MSNIFSDYFTEVTGQTPWEATTNTVGGVLFSGRDDIYNHIQGLGHRGIGWRLRRAHTDFGSGYRGSAVIDFETADFGRDSPISLAIHGSDNKSWQFKFRPARGSILPKFTDIHKISLADVANQPSFAEQWPEINRALSQYDEIWAHNAKFDSSVLHASLASAGITPPPIQIRDTLDLAGRAWHMPYGQRRLSHIAERLGIQLEHHNAASDAAATAEYLRQTKAKLGISEAASSPFPLPTTGPTNQDRSSIKQLIKDHNWSERKALRKLANTSPEWLGRFRRATSTTEETSVFENFSRDFLNQQAQATRDIRFARRTGGTLDPETMLKKVTTLGPAEEPQLWHSQWDVRAAINLPSGERKFYSQAVSAHGRHGALNQAWIDIAAQYPGASVDDMSSVRMFGPGGRYTKFDRIAMGFADKEMGEQIPAEFLDEWFPSGAKKQVAAATTEQSTVNKVIRGHWKKLAIGGAVAGLFLTKPLSLFSGKDDEYNSIEGLRHGGIAEQIRKGMTEFGSGWDPLRALAKQIYGEGAESFTKLTRSKEFSAALSAGKEVTKLGEGAYGDAYLMETALNIGGKEHSFKFVKKIGKETARTEDMYREMEAMSKLQDLNAPSVYSFKDKTLNMEFIQGKPMEEMYMRGGGVSKEAINDLEQFLNESHKRGIAHMDLFQDVKRFQRNDIAAKNMGWRGELVPRNIMITPEGRAAVIDYGIWQEARKKATDDFIGVATGGAPVGIVMQSYAGKYTETAGAFDNLLIESLRKFQGKMSERSKQYLSLGKDIYAEGAAPTALPPKLGNATVKSASTLKVKGKRVDTAVTAKPGMNDAATIVPTPVAAATVKNNTSATVKMKKHSMSVAQQATMKQSFERAKNGGRRHASTYAASPTLVDYYGKTYGVR